MVDFEHRLSNLKALGIYRSLEQGKGIDFASNDYLGFSKNEAIRDQLLKFMKTSYSLGSTGSRLVSGNFKEMEEIENFISEIFQSESSLYFGSGYLANLGVLSSIGGEDTEFFSDEYNHASIIDGIRLSKSIFKVFKHNDSVELEQFLQKSTAKRKIIISESIFSMEGDQAPVEILEKLAEKFNAYLILDEAHATGTCGPDGLGLAFTLKWNRVLSIHTCGKALGGYGAFVCCSMEMKEFLINHARSFIFTTAPAPFMVAQTRFALTEFITKKSHFCKLTENVEFSKNLFQKHGLMHTGTHIVPFIVGSSHQAVLLAQSLQAAGIFSKAIRFPSVPENSARLRLTLKSFHTGKQIRFLCDYLEKFQLEQLLQKEFKCISS